MIDIISNIWQYIHHIHTQRPSELPSKAQPSVSGRMLLSFKLFLPYRHIILNCKSVIFYARATLDLADKRLNVHV